MIANNVGDNVGDVAGMGADLYESFVGSIVSMTALAAAARRTDALDSLGNTTAATGKGFAIGSAALTALTLIASYVDQIYIINPLAELSLSITNPPVLIGLFVGGMLPFLFTALTMNAVGRAAMSIVYEVRRRRYAAYRHPRCLILKENRQKEIVF